MQYECNRFYIAFGKKYRNIWRAYDAFVGTNHNVEPYLENDTFSNLQGLKIDLDRDYESEFLKSLFQRFDNLTLMYSGGVDSHTIAVKARQNNLNFSKTVCLTHNLNDLPNKMDNTYVNDYVLDFFKDDRNFEICPNSIEQTERIIKNSEWWYTGGELNTTQITNFLDLPVYSHDTVYVAGKDKPFLLYSKGEWWIVSFHASLSDLWEVPNILFFYGLNEFCPEIQIQHARRAKKFYCDTYGTPSKTQFIHYKMHLGEEVSDNFIRSWNKNIGRTGVPGSTHETDQGQLNPTISKKGIERLYDLNLSSRHDIVVKFLNDCKNLYHKHPQIDWEFPPFEFKGRPAWFVNLDSLEYVPGDEMHTIVDQL